MSATTKLERLARLCRNARVGGIVLQTQANFAWISDGRSNRIDATREVGAGAILVAADGRRFILANAIEMPRLRDEALAGEGYEPIEFPWTDEHAKPDSIASIAKRALGTETIGADWTLPAAVPLEREIARERAPLTELETDRYRALGREAGEAVGGICRSLVPGIAEIEVGRMVADAIARVRARAIVTLIAADDRIRRYRHPIPTDTPWHRLLMVVVCAQRDGLIVSLSRIVSAGAPPADVVELTRRTAMVFGQVLGATRNGTTGRELYETTVAGYAQQGFRGEERLHHQGGATGYRSRDWLAHPASEETVRGPPAFAWNPSITGTKVEETALITSAGAEIITTSPDWPSIVVDAGGTGIAAPGILQVA